MLASGDVEKNNKRIIPKSVKKTLSGSNNYTLSGRSDLLNKIELTSLHKKETYYYMTQDADISTCIDLREGMIESATKNGSFVDFDPSDENSIFLKEFLEYNFRNLDKQTLSALARYSIKGLLYGFVAFEMVFERSLGSKWDTDLTRYKLKKLSPIDPLTLNWDTPVNYDQKGQIASLNQIAAGQLATSYSSSKESNGIPIQKLAICSHGNVGDYVLNSGILDSIYVEWKEKCLLADYQVTGTIKNLCGVPIIKVPGDLFDTAEDPETDPQERANAEAQLSRLQEDLENLALGNSTGLILDSGTHPETNTPLYSVQLKGIDGSISQVDTDATIQNRRNSIYRRFGCTHLLSNDSPGSYNLIEGQANIASSVSKADQIAFEQMLEDVVKTLLALNGWDTTQVKVPRWESGEITPLGVDSFSKAISLCGRLLPLTPEICNEILKKIGLSTRVDESLTTEELRELLVHYEDKSKVGTSEGSSGTGDSQQAGNSSHKNLNK